MKDSYERARSTACIRAHPYDGGILSRERHLASDALALLQRSTECPAGFATEDRRGDGPTRLPPEPVRRELQSPQSKDARHPGADAYRPVLRRLGAAARVAGLVPGLLDGDPDEPGR